MKLQIYTLDNSYKALHLQDNVLELCKNFELQISEQDMEFLNEKIFKIEKEFPFDGIHSSQLWKLTLAADNYFKKFKKYSNNYDMVQRIDKLLKKLKAFTAIADGTILKLKKPTISKGRLRIVKKRNQ